MSTAGIYGFFPMIEEPEHFRVQTATQQPPFFFGGSQVPINLGINNKMMGKGFTNLQPLINTERLQKALSISKGGRIYRPKSKKLKI